jgi:hypothetical protein
MPTPHDPSSPATAGQSTDLALPTALPLTDLVIRWVGWHLLELTALGVPTALAVTVSPWWAAPAVLVGGLWVTHEIRLTRRHRVAPTSGPDRTTPDRTTTPRGPARDEEASAS